MLYAFFLIPFFWITALFAVFSLVLLPVPSFRPAGKKFFFGTIGSVISLISYQLAYIPVCFAGLVLLLPVGLLNELFGGIYVVGMSLKYALFFLFFVLWFIVLLWGYISGFRTGWQYGGGTPLLDSIRSDYLARIYLRIANRSTQYIHNSSLDIRP